MTTSNNTVCTPAQDTTHLGDIACQASIDHNHVQRKIQYATSVIEALRDHILSEYPDNFAANLACLAHELLRESMNNSEKLEKTQNELACKVLELHSREDA